MTTAVQRAPRFSIDDAELLAADLYDLEVSAAPLPSERDQNFLLTTALGKRFVLKVANAEEEFDFLNLQNEIIRRLAASNIDLDFPQIIPTKTGEDMASITSADSQPHFVRLLTWLDGDCFARVQPHNPKLLRSLGRGLAQMDAALADFDHSAAHRSFYWDLRNADTIRGWIELLPTRRRSLIEGFLNEWEKIDWTSLRFSVIHNDANDYNVLVRGDGSAQRVSAIIDYGDVVYTATVCNLAVALAYVMLDKSDPIRAAAQVVTAYQEVFPLNESEIDALYILTLTRLCVSVLIAAKQTRAAPDNEYLSISNAPVWCLLEKLREIPFDWPTRVFRFAAGVPVVSDRSSTRRPASELLAQRKRSLGASLSVSYESPLHIVAGSRQFLFDSSGRRYLDCVNNVAHVGHSHPYVVRAASEQMARLNTNTRYLHELLTEYSERLTATLPDPLCVVYFVNSGSEANELALRMARAHTRKSDVIVIDCAYHGNTSAMIDLSPYKFDGPGGRGCPSWVHKVALPDVYRGKYRGPDAGHQYAAELEGAIQAAEPNGGVAAFLCESAVSCGGQIILPDDYLRKAYAAVRAAGGVCVADEVQTGFGRTGSHFWMFETQGVVPDIVTLGKPIGNGHPIGAVVSTPEIAASFANGMEYFNTFGGNPVSCAVGLAVLDVIRDEELQQNAHDVGAYLKERLIVLKSTHPLIGDVRGQGLFIGIEFVRDRETLEPADREAVAVVERMKEHGVLLSTDGPFHNVIKIKPPLVFSRRDADDLFSKIDSVLTNLQASGVRTQDLR